MVGMRRTLSGVAILASFLIIQVTCDVAPKKSKVVTTLLNAKWARTPFHLEASEFLSDESSDFFWSYLDYFAEPDNLDLESKLNDEELYQRIITFASR